jgi:hypothetical protein
MTIKLFDLQNGVIIPSEHCYTLKALSVIMDEYPDDYVKIYQYLFYMSCPNPELNPFFHVQDIDKEDMIINQLDIEFSPEEELIIEALEFCRTLYETPTSRAYKGIKTMLDNLATYMSETSITHGRDGNINSIVAAATKFQQIRQSYKDVYSDLMSEQSNIARGGANLAYDQR